MKLHKLLFSLFSLGFALFFIYRIYQPVFYSFGFTDEGDNISIGQYILKGKLLYRDIFSQHQPLTYYVSAGIQTISHPDNVLLVVRRHRQFVFAFSFVWIIFLTLRFGLGLLPFLTLIEVLKYYFLGHLFLAESLIIYPLLYLVFIWWRSINGAKLIFFDALSVSLCCFFIIFNLLPLVPLAGCIMATLLTLNRRNRKKIFILVSPLLFLTGILFVRVPFNSYIEGTIWANFFYYIPQSTKLAFNVEESKFTTLFKIFFYPATTFFVSANPITVVYRFLTIAWFFGILALVKNRKKIFLALGLLGILTLSNLRPAFGSHIFYHAFHSLPFFVLFTGALFMVLKIAKNKLFQLLGIGIFLSVLAYVSLSKTIYIHENLNQGDVAYVNFAEVFTYSTVIKALSTSTDTLMVVPHEELLYWYSHLMPATRFLFYEAWVHDVPAFKKEIYEGLAQNPPTFVYWPEDQLEPFLKSDDYIHIARNTASYSALHIHKSKVSHITDSQWNDISVHGFRKPL